MKYVYVCSAKLFNIFPRKGAIFAGSDADIIIFNPNSTFHISAQSHHSRSDTNVYEGRSGKVIHLVFVSKFTVMYYIYALSFDLKKC